MNSSHLFFKWIDIECWQPSITWIYVWIYVHNCHISCLTSLFYAWELLSFIISKTILTITFFKLTIKLLPYSFQIWWIAWCAELLFALKGAIAIADTRLFNRKYSFLFMKSQLRIKIQFSGIYRLLFCWLGSRGFWFSNASDGWQITHSLCKFIWISQFLETRYCEEFVFTHVFLELLG